METERDFLVLFLAHGLAHSELGVDYGLAKSVF